MKIELSHFFEATPEQLWDVLLDPVVMAGCVPGTENVEVISPTEYSVQLKVKIAFIKARFNISVQITESDPPRLLRCETAGEDKSVASSVKSENEMVLEAIDDGHTRLNAKSVATVFGRLGTLGLNPMRTKAERMWAEFCANIEAVLQGDAINPVDPADDVQLAQGIDESKAQSSTHAVTEEKRRFLRWPRRQSSQQAS